MGFVPSITLLVYILSGISSLLNTSTKAEPLTGTDITRVEKGKLSYVVSIALRNDQLPEEETHICTGVLIGRKFVLTAAHCFDNILLKDIRIIIGSVDLREGTKYNPSRWITYNQWAADDKNMTKDDGINDIAIIKLLDRVSIYVARVASLMYESSNNLKNVSVVLVGWGKTNESHTYASRYLYKARVKVLPNQACENFLYETFNRDVPISQKHFCTQGQQHAFVAPGDSGGAVLRERFVVGISRGSCPKNGLVCDSSKKVLDDYKFNLHLGIHDYKEFIADVLDNY